MREQQGFTNRKVDIIGRGGGVGGRGGGGGGGRGPGWGGRTTLKIVGLLEEAKFHPVAHPAVNTGRGGFRVPRLGGVTGRDKMIRDGE